jgi:hypothetical protein
MILDAAEKFQLAKKVQQYLPDYAFNVTVHANNAVRVKNIRERFMKILFSKENPDGYIIQTSTSIFLPLSPSLPLAHAQFEHVTFLCENCLIAIRDAIQTNLFCTTSGTVLVPFHITASRFIPHNSPLRQAPSLPHHSYPF